MRLKLWLFLVLGVSVSSSDGADENNDFENIDSSSEALPPTLALAKDIFRKERECENLVWNAVDEVLNDLTRFRFPIPDERYFQCKKVLGDMKLLYGKLTKLPASAEEKANANPVFDDQFDVQDELCAINKRCLNLINNQFSKQNKEKGTNLDLNDKISRCTDILNDLKLKYIHMKSLDEEVLKKERGLYVKCIGGPITFTLPTQMNDLDYYTTSHSMYSVASKIKSSSDISAGDEESVMDSTKPDAVEDPNKKAAAQLNPLLEKHLDLEDPTTSMSYASEHKPSSIVPMDETKTSQSKREISGKSESSERNVLNKESHITDDNLPPENENNKVIDKENTTNYMKVTNDYNKKGKKKGTTVAETNDGSKSSRIIYRMKVVSNNGEEKVINIVTSGQVKETENNRPSPKSSEGFSSRIIPDSAGCPTEPVKHIDTGYPAPVKKAAKVNSIRPSESLEDSIILMENDCKELLRFGEQLLNHKILQSLMSFENQYNECVSMLDDLKNKYIEKYKLDISSYRNVFPLALPSGEKKLVMLPKQLYKSSEESASLHASQTRPDDYSDSKSFPYEINPQEYKTFKNRKPFEDPAFIPNDRFLEILKQDTASPSTFSKVANMLHINGGHTEKNIYE